MEKAKKTQKVQKQIKEKKILERILFTIINLLIVEIVTPIMIILLIVNLILVIVKNRRSHTIVDITKAYIRIIVETFEFMAFISEKIPYPFK